MAYKHLQNTIMNRVCFILQPPMQPIEHNADVIPST